MLCFVKFVEVVVGRCRRGKQSRRDASRTREDDAQERVASFPSRQAYALVAFETLDLTNRLALACQRNRRHNSSAMSTCMRRNDDNIKINLGPLTT